MEILSIRGTDTVYGIKPNASRSHHNRWDRSPRNRIVSGVSGCPTAHPLAQGLSPANPSLPDCAVTRALLSV
jgi:hypothetical protein